jgi:hypothetical protein
MAVSGGCEGLAEYRLETGSPRVVSIVEAESTAPFGVIWLQWGDLFDIDAFPAVTAEQGMGMLKQGISEQG